MKLKAILATAVMLGAVQAPAQAAEYELDTRHSFVEFRIQHLGFSWLYGRFNDLGGSFSHDPESPENNAVDVQIDPARVDSKDAEAGTLEGELTLHGVTKPVTIDVKKVGEGESPWGDYRAGFIGTTTIDRREFGIDYDLGPAVWEMELELSVEGIQQ